MSEGQPEDDIVRVRFDGGLADEHRVPLTELIVSLEGWRDYLLLTSDAFVQGRLTTDRPDKSQRVEYQVHAVKPGSVEIDLIGIASWFADHLVGGAIGASGVYALPKLWKWRQEVYKRQVQSRRDDVTVEEAAAALARLAEESEIVVGQHDDPVKVVEEIDKSIKRALRPVKTSVANVTVITNNTTIQIVGGASDKTAISKKYAAVTQPEEIREPEERVLDIRSVDPDKKTAKFYFVDPQDEDEKGLKQGLVTDPRILRAGDPYTGALHERTHIRLIVQKKLLNSKSKAIRWELSKPGQEQQTEMFPID